MIKIKQHDNISEALIEDKASEATAASVMNNSEAIPMNA